MTFHEQWYSEAQCQLLQELVRSVKFLDGSIIEFGSWEGKSTCALANAAYPEIVLAVDTWKGNVDEGESHPSVLIASSRNVRENFDENVSILTRGNVKAVQQDCHEFMAEYTDPVKFCHIDACHDYDSVSRSLAAVLPYMVEGGIMCGDDFLTAHREREDLGGGVERAVSETLLGYKNIDNLWFWRKA